MVSVMNRKSISLSKVLPLLTLSIGMVHSSIAMGQNTSAAREEMSLTKATGGRFEIGVGVSDLIAEQPEKWDLLKKHFTILTPENCMKPQSFQPSEDQINSTRPDQFIDFALKNNLRVVGHTLVWAKDDRTPPWFYLDGDKPASKEVLLERMRKYIRTEMGRYKGKIAMWDVVNEAIDDGSEFIRPSGWQKACGEDYIAEAFRCAHEIDPDALLIYNDYNNELPGKREKMLRLITSLQAKKVPLHAIGLQGHYEIDRIPLKEIEDTIIEVKKLGLKVVVSELDIDVVPRGRWWADGGKYREEMASLNPYKDGCPADVLQRQADQYAALFAIFNKHSDSILRVSFWNLHDGDSWLNYFPWNRVNHPLLFDRDQKPKPAFHAVIKALQGDR